jgi:hypothetical protein
MRQQPGIANHAKTLKPQIPFDCAQGKLFDFALKRFAQDDTSKFESDI